VIYSKAVARKSNLIKLGDAISQLFKQEKLDVKISQFTVKNNWKDIVGDMVANSTSEIFFNDKTIFITLSSAALKHELSFRKEELLTSINKFCGYKLVDQIVIR
jgi:predicted nucleic acid-binding Zn ribbon protein